MIAKQKIWPETFSSVGRMLRASAIVKIGCSRCANIFDVDLKAIETRRGSTYSLIDRHPQCVIATCRGEGYFLAAQHQAEPMMPLMNSDSSTELPGAGVRPIDLEPPLDPPPGIAVAARA